jgi:riboflavin kinase/FMN adenylyltransferase
MIQEHKNFAVYSWDDAAAGKFPIPPQGTALTVGTFDGPHLGHAALFDDVLAQKDLAPGVVTFAKPPASLWRPDTFPGLIVPLEERLAFLRQKGFAFAVVIDFSKQFSIIKGSEFLAALARNCGMRFLSEGAGFRAGYQGAWDIPAIEMLSKEMGFRLSIQEPRLFQGERISSSRIRQAMRNGDFALAEQMLGRPLNWVTQKDTHIRS